MLIGVPKETKNHEYRVGVTPAGVRALRLAGHTVRVQSGAAESIGFPDEAYASVGANIVPMAADVYACPLVVKVKEPQADELALLQEGQTLFCYLHLAADAELTAQLVQRKIIGIAYETVEESGLLPLLMPMSEVAGRIATQVGANSLHIANGGRGVLLGGVPGAAPGRVLIIGAGTVGTHAAQMALGLGADVILLDTNLMRLRHLDEVFGGRIGTRYSEPHTIEELAREADLLIGSVLIPGKRAPKLLSRDIIRNMKKGSVLVDVAIDQGGCAETSRPTTHSEPTYVEEGVVHYCVTNIPAACARTSTQALTNATLPFLLQLASQGTVQALRNSAALRKGLNLYRGHVTQSNVADDLGYPYLPPEQAAQA